MARTVLIILGVIQLIFAVIAVGLSGYLNGKYDNYNPSIRFFISACVITGLLSVACMVSACLNQNIAGIFGCSVVASIYWLVATSWFGKDISDYIFHLDTWCGADGDPDTCDSARVGAAAFAFGLLLLFLWLGSTVVAAIGFFSGRRPSRAASFRNSGAPPQFAHQAPQYGQQSPQYGQPQPPAPQAYGQYPAPYPAAQAQFGQPQYAPAQPHQANNFQPMNVQQQQTNKVPI